MKSSNLDRVFLLPKVDKVISGPTICGFKWDKICGRDVWWVDFTAGNLHGAHLPVERVELKVHRAGQRQGDSDAAKIKTSNIFTNPDPDASIYCLKLLDFKKRIWSEKLSLLEFSSWVWLNHTNPNVWMESGNMECQQTVWSYHEKKPLLGWHCFEVGFYLKSTRPSA